MAVVKPEPVKVVPASKSAVTVGFDVPQREKTPIHQIEPPKSEVRKAPSPVPPAEDTPKPVK